MSVSGRFQIKRISPEDASAVTFQVSFERFQGGEFVGSVEAEHLSEFLREKLRLSESSVRALGDELRSHGHVIVPELELSESDLAAAGLAYLDPAV
jgi:predicted N-acetyltransferase YhbS